jgi:hypothetical protein
MKRSAVVNAQRVCEVLRNDIKALIKANARSWDQGHAMDRVGVP